MRESPLVIFPGALGDLVCFVPALREIERRSGRRPILWCKGDLVPLVEETGVAEARPIDARETSWLFSATPPDEAGRFFGAFASIDSFTGASVPEVERNLARWQGSRGRAHPFRPSERIHLALHFLRRVAPERTSVAPSAAGLSLTPRVPAGFAVRPFLVVHPGSGGRTKRWSRDGFVEVARRWGRRGGDVLVVIGPAEEREEDEWRRADLPISPPLDVVELARLLAGCDAYLGNDSGPSHLAAVVGARGVTLFGPTDPALWAPLSDELRALRLDPWATCDQAAAGDSIDAVERALAAVTSP